MKPLVLEVTSRLNWELDADRVRSTGVLGSVAVRRNVRGVRRNDQPVLAALYPGLVGAVWQRNMNQSRGE